MSGESDASLAQSLADAAQAAAQAGGDGLSTEEVLNQVADEYAEKLHLAQSVAVMISVSLLILTILTIWVFKRWRLRFIHETGMSIFYGVIVGAIIRFSKSDTHQLEENTVFDPALFFYMLLPPIIFAAGYNVQKKHFFRNITEILVFAFVGTFISTLVIGFLAYFVVWLNIEGLADVLSLHDCLQFGALISAVDPVTVLAIFSELNVDADLYAMVFGESVLNDAVALVMYSTITAFRGTTFTLKSMLAATLDFVSNFCGSMCIGVFIALLTALITKYSDLGRHTVLETSFVLLMSYTSYILGEGFGLSGIVAILFCGMGQSHYTSGNLSPESQHLVHWLAEILNFMAENFIFSYLGISLFTFAHHKFKPIFIVLCIVFIVIGRVLNIYPLSFIMNKTRRWRKIPLRYQTMMVWSGLRGAIAFALAMKNTSTEGKQVITSTTLVIVIFTVLVFGGGTLSMMELLNIPFHSAGDDFRQVEGERSGPSTSLFRPTDGRIAYWWLRMDRTYLKPVFTKMVTAPAHAPSRAPAPADDDSMSDEDEFELEIRRAHRANSPVDLMRDSSSVL